MVLCSELPRLRRHPVSPNQCVRLGLTGSLKPSRNGFLQSRMHVEMCRKVLPFVFSYTGIQDSKALPPGAIRRHCIDRKSNAISMGRLPGYTLLTRLGSTTLEPMWVSAIYIQLTDTARRLVSANELHSLFVSRSPLSLLFYFSRVLRGARERPGYTGCMRP